MKPTTKSISGTSFHDSIVRATVNQLISICGQPHDDSNTGEDKVNFEWDMELDNGDVITIYDWKEYRMIDVNELIDWHIGGKNKDITDIAEDELNTVLYSAKQIQSLSEEDVNAMLQDEYEHKLDTDEVAE
jgi:hypothetical protein